MARRARSALACSVLPARCIFIYLSLAFCFSISSLSGKTAIVKRTPTHNTVKNEPALVSYVSNMAYAVQCWLKLNPMQKEHILAAVTFLFWKALWVLPAQYLLLSLISVQLDLDFQCLSTLPHLSFSTECKRNNWKYNNQPSFTMYKKKTYNAIRLVNAVQMTCVSSSSLSSEADSVGFSSTGSSFTAAPSSSSCYATCYSLTHVFFVWSTISMCKLNE